MHMHNMRSEAPKIEDLLKDQILPKDDGSAIFHLKDYAAKYSDYSEDIMRPDLNYVIDNVTGLRDYSGYSASHWSYSEDPVLEKYYSPWGKRGISDPKMAKVWRFCGQPLGKAVK